MILLKSGMQFPLSSRYSSKFGIIYSHTAMNVSKLELLVFLVCTQHALASLAAYIPDHTGIQDCTEPMVPVTFWLLEICV